MKRKRVIICSLLLALSLSGCSNTQTDEEQTETEQMEIVLTEKDQTETETDTDNEENSENGMETGNEEVTSGESGMEAEWDAPVRIYGVISEVWVDQSTIVVNNQSGNSSAGEIELIIDTENTLVLDASTGYPVALEDVEIGSFEAYLGQEMTLSLPPQTTPYAVIVNIPADSAVPQYAVVASIEENAEGNVVITATDGRAYVVAETAQIVPYRTKNIVTVEDIQIGGACLIWMDEDGTASKVQLFDAAQESGEAALQ
ncbi:MAG: hypothetical protein LUC90_11765 [Lachnospiraceae bacterium]|nr:hypothetical protein [Lachnospiraceae bacterium]